VTPASRRSSPRSRLVGQISVCSDISSASSTSIPRYRTALSNLWTSGHRLETTQIYLVANLAMKQAVLDKTTPPEGKPGRYRPDDRLLAFLKGL
jgi:hypothetical protein